jgi:signal transduction histidine kinase
VPNKREKLAGDVGGKVPPSGRRAIVRKLVSATLPARQPAIERRAFERRSSDRRETPGDGFRAAYERERRVAEALKTVARALAKAEDLESLLELVLRKMTEVVDAERATLYLRDAATGELSSRVVEGQAVQHIRLRVGEGLAGHVAKYGKPLVVNDAYADARFSKAWDKKTGFRTKSVLVVPILDHEGQTIGVAQVLNKREGKFTLADTTTLSVLATQAATSIEHFRLLESLKSTNAELLQTKVQLEHRVRDLRLLFDLESAMGRVTSLEELLRGILSEAKRVVGVEFAAFVLREPESDLPTLHVIEGEQVIRYPTQSGEGLIGAAMSEARIVQSDKAAKDPRGSRTLDKRVGIVSRSALCIPLEDEDGTFGALGLYNKLNKATFDEDDRGLLQLIAVNAATAIKLQWSRETQERQERLTTIGRLLSGVIHDMKTPLSIISGYVDLMRAASDKKLRNEYGDLVLKQFSHIGSMQRDVLEFARGEKTTLIRKVYLVAFFEAVQKALEVGFAKTQVTLELELRDRGTARFDEAQVLRLVQNLARNSMEAMGPQGGGIFRIDVARVGQGLQMTFSDTGPGIPKEVEGRLFRSFVTSGKKGGTGLGLAIVKRVVDEHGGTIAAQSSKRGATFRVTLPQPSQGSE